MTPNNFAMVQYMHLPPSSKFELSRRCPYNIGTGLIIAQCSVRSDNPTYLVFLCDLGGVNLMNL